MTMRAAYEQYRALYAPLIETGSVTEAMVRGAFAAGVTHGLVMVSTLSPDNTVVALQRMNAEMEEFWQQREPGGAS